MSIPYMGSKAKIAVKLINEITINNPQATTFIDLFGGGGAMSEEALNRTQFKRVIYNELNKGVANLFKKIKQDGITHEFYEFVSREEFNDMKNGDCWRAGLIKTCWSFGNDQRSYLYGKDIEDYKKAFHDLVMTGADTRKFMQDFLEKYVFEKYGIAQSCTINLPIQSNFQERRLAVRKDLTLFEKNCKNTQSIGARQLQYLEGLQQLQHLEGLQRLQRLNHLEFLEVFNISAFDFDFSGYNKDTTVVYLDPPYFGVGGYQEKIKASLDKFASLGVDVYLSEYTNPNPEVWQEVFQVEKVVTMSAIQTTKKIERLFKNKE